MLAVLWPPNEDSYRCMMGVVTIQASLIQVHICTDGRVTVSQSMRSLKTACLVHSSIQHWTGWSLVYNNSPRNTLNITTVTRLVIGGNKILTSYRTRSEWLRRGFSVWNKLHGNSDVFIVWRHSKMQIAAQTSVAGLLSLTRKSALSSLPVFTSYFPQSPCFLLKHTVCKRTTLKATCTRRDLSLCC